jgi:hypothetical protein
LERGGRDRRCRSTTDSDPRRCVCRYLSFDESPTDSPARQTPRGD